MSVEKVIKLKEKEKILGVVRQMPLVYFWSMLLVLILIVAPFFFMIPLFSFGKIGAVGFVFFISVGLLVFFRILVRWYWTVFIVTNHRVVDVDQKGIFDRYVSEASYDKIQDVAYARKGILGTILNYGTLVIQTAGSNAHLEQYFVRHPKEIQHMVVEAMGTELAGPSGERNDKVSALLEAASVLTNTEAKAFITELKEAVDEESEMAGATEDEIENFMKSNQNDGPSIFDQDKKKN